MITTTHARFDRNPSNPSPLWAKHAGSLAVLARRKGIKIAGITNAPFAELFLNGKSLGMQATTRLGELSWGIATFSAGNLTMVAYDDHNRTVATDTMLTVGEAASVQLQIDTPRSPIHA